MATESEPAAIADTEVAVGRIVANAQVAGR